MQILTVIQSGPFLGREPVEELGPADSNDYYTDQGRLIRYLHGSSDEPVNREHPGQGLNESIDECVSEADIAVNPDDDTATVRFTVEEGCEYEFSLVSYTKDGPGWSRESAENQELFDATTETYDAGEHTLTVELPTANENGS